MNAPSVCAPGSPLSGSAAERLVLLVAPTPGRFRPSIGGGSSEIVPAGSVLGQVTGGRGRADDIRCPVDVIVEGFLVRPGHPVRSGEAVAWGRVVGPGPR